MKRENKWIGDKSDGIEVRYNKDGTLDEVLLYRDGEAVLHLEQMDKDYWWMSVCDKKGNEIFVNFVSATPILADHDHANWPEEEKNG